MRVPIWNREVKRRVDVNRRPLDSPKERGRYYREFAVYRDYDLQEECEQERRE